MFVSAEVSFYPLSDDFTTPIDRFLALVEASGLDHDTGAMSTVINGEYEAVMGLLTVAMEGLMDDWPSVFNLKISNACPAR